MIEYLKLVEKILKEGEEKSDRTGTGTISLPFQQMRFPLYDGSIPLLTTKKMHVRSIIYELLWYLQGNTSNKELERHNVSIWREWADEDGRLGPIYGRMWRSFPPPEGYFPIKKRIIEKDTTQQRSWKDSRINTSLVHGKYSGKVFNNTQGLLYIVLGVDGQNSNGTKGSRTSTYAVQFENTKWIKYKVDTRLVKNGNFVDQSIPSVYNVGILGDYRNKKETRVNKKLRRVWEQMISRCYNEKDALFHRYGGRGVIVCNRWLVLSDFITDVKQLPNWFEAQHNDGYELDKDYYGDNKIYHPETCVWVLKCNNNQHKTICTSVLLKNEQEAKYFPSINSAATFLGTTSLPISHRIRHGLDTRIKNFTVQPFNNSEYVVRSLPHFDQIADAINTLRTNPTDRRIVVTSWHPSLAPRLSATPSINAQLGYQSLPPCHAFFQFWSNGSGELRCHLYQRSCDVGLGVPFNIVQYSILTHMIAHVTGHTAVEFVWTGGDVHIYKNHIEQLKQQLQRTPHTPPKLELNPNVTEINDFTYEDINIISYTHHPAIRMDVSV